LSEFVVGAPSVLLWTNPTSCQEPSGAGLLPCGAFNPKSAIRDPQFF
jgi:hypothetical protein